MSMVNEGHVQGVVEADEAEMITNIFQLNDKNAAQIKLLQVEAKTALCDYFVICSGNSNTQIKSFSGEVEYKLETDCGIMPKNIEGYTEASWIVMDYGNVIVHIFNRETRDFYKLEKLWEDGVSVDISDLLTEK